MATGSPTTERGNHSARGTPAHVPAHLEHLVVEQDYGAYSEIAHSVWRFVLRNNYSRLTHTAHPAYAKGLMAAGMSLERIPRIAEMDDHLSAFGWRAVSVDGFIPPRAFVEFQSLGILPIAADIRTLAHLAYTPAPDIIHEAGGHAPFLADPEYGAFIRAVGAVGRKAFTLPEDQRVYRAIYTLSEIKEDPTATPDRVQRAEQHLDRALAACQRTSDAAKLARLYWWTAEYGLVGTPNDYKIYGAGLLSSLWESHSCHDPKVEKRPLTARCIDVAYDITEPQPQLFVARDFGSLEAILREVEGELRHSRGGVEALAAAVASEEPATVILETGIALGGQLVAFDAAEGVAAELFFRGRCQLQGATVDGAGLEMARSLALDDYQGPTGRLAPAHWAALARQSIGDEVTVRYLNGAQVRGRLLSRLSNPQGALAGMLLTEAVSSRADHADRWLQGPYPVLFGAVETAHASAGPSPSDSEARRRPSLVPRSGRSNPSEAALERKYEEALALVRDAGGSALEAGFRRIHQDILRDFPGEWLLRWNLLEGVLAAKQAPDLAQALREELAELEIRYGHREPIAMGLGYLSREFGLKGSSNEGQG